MKKPNNYENTQAQGEFTPVELGGHKMVIKSVEERMSKTNKPMIVVFFDFAPGDKQAGYFMESFKNDIRPEKKWPNQGTQYILTEDENGDCSRSFKTFLTCVEHSNNEFTTQWGDNFGQQFKGKLIGGLFNEREYEKKDGSVGRMANLAQLCSVEKIRTGKFKLPDDKLLPNRPTTAAPAAPDDFMAIPEGEDDSLPFD